MEKRNAGDSNQITRDYFDSLLLETRYLDTDIASTELRLYGETFRTPIMNAALSHLHQVCDNAMVEIAKGAKNAGAVHWVGMCEDEELEQIVATGAKTIKIIKPHADNGEVFRRIEHAKKAGVFAVGMDIDHAIGRNGHYDVVLGLPMKPKSTEELADFVRAAYPLPFIVKGVLSTADALKCLDAGVRGIVVSHHHGIMNYSIPPLMVLPDIVKAVGGKMPIFVDCGVESGMDVFKALALGATAVSVGRDLMEALKGGAEGVENRINQLNEELSATMSRTGAQNLHEIDSSVIWRRQF